MHISQEERLAFSYLRFSSPEQARGDSFRRQTEAAELFAAVNGLRLDNSLTFHDLGVSAYRGANSETGQLSKLLEAVKIGLIPKGSAILVESLDRISRQSARKALRILEDVVELGVSIITISDRREYTIEALDNDPLSLLMVILTFIRANEESTIKSQRVSAAWDAKRRSAHTVPITSCCPTWLKISEDKSRFFILEDRAKTIRSIFIMYASGESLFKITRVLNAEKVPPLRAGKDHGKYWTPGSVRLVLTSESVLGTLVPFKQKFVEGKLVRTKLQPIENYYPPILAADLFERVQVRLNEKISSTPNVNRRPRRNIIGHITRCGHCGSGMAKLWGYEGRYMVCRNTLANGGCKCASVWYNEVIDAFICILKRSIKLFSKYESHSLTIWCSQIELLLKAAPDYDVAELNRIIRRECSAIRVFHDTGFLQVVWKNGVVMSKKRAFTPSSAKSTRSQNKAALQKILPTTKYQLPTSEITRL